NINDQQIKIFVSDVYGKEIYQTSGSDNTYVFGKGFSSGVYFVRIIQANNIKTLKLIKVN
ncbi:MAG TPA: T9SS type A sorting domain-containing protein, partial [Parafilimonas sp.]